MFAGLHSSQSPGKHKQPSGMQEAEARGRYTEGVGSERRRHYCVCAWCLQQKAVKSQLPTQSKACGQACREIKMLLWRGFWNWELERAPFFFQKPSELSMVWAVVALGCCKRQNSGGRLAVCMATSSEWGLVYL